MSPPTPPPSALDPGLHQPGPRFVGRVLTATLIVFASALMLMLLWYGRHVLLLLLAGMLVAQLLRMPANWLHRHTGLDRRWSVAGLVVLLLILSVVLGVFAGPAIADQLQALQEQLMHAFEQLHDRLEQSRLGRLLLDSLPDAGDADLQAMWQRFAGVWATVLGGLGSLLLILVAGVFLAWNPGLYMRGLLRLVPLHKRERACQVAGRLGHDLHQWLLSQMIEMVVLAVLVAAVLWLLGLPLVLPLALIAGITNFVPYVGPFIGLLPVAAVGFTDSPHTGLLAVGGYFLAQVIEGNLILPLVYQRLIHLPPVVTLAAQVLFGTLAGLLGVALAAPLAVVAIVLTQMLYVEDALGDRLDRPPADGHCPVTGDG